MAEILLSLTIIGVVAAITLPSLTGNINERTWNTQRKALYARMSQAIALMPALNGYGTLTEESSSSAGDAVDTAAETFVTAGLSKVLKINNVCDSEHLTDCGVAKSIIPFNNSDKLELKSLETLGAFNSLFLAAQDGPSGISYSQINTKAAAFETANGESIIAYYNPYCISDTNSTALHSWDFVQRNMCANFVYDLNGSKGPNTVGKDIGFVSVLYPSDSVVVSPMPTNLSSSLSLKNAIKWCTTQDSESRLPNRDEAAALFYNKNLIGNLPASIWSSSLVSSDTAWYLMPRTGARKLSNNINGNEQFVCVKR